MSYKWVQTQDGSWSIRHTDLQELYHNQAGAWTEALENYVKPSESLSLLKKTGELKVLDVCFGLGYNSFVLLNTLLEGFLTYPGRPIRCQVTALETDLGLAPFWPRILEDPRFTQLSGFGYALEHNIYYRTLWNGIDFTYEFAPGVEIRFQFLPGDLRKTLPFLRGPYDLVFHDAFSPAKVPELWTLDLFKQYNTLLAPRHGKLLTYSRAKLVLEQLEEAGFQLSKTPAVGYKRGGTLAITPGSEISSTTS